jgi:hypothetical protein
LRAIKKKKRGEELGDHSSKVKVETTVEERRIE